MYWHLILENLDECVVIKDFMALFLEVGCSPRALCPNPICLIKFC